MLDTDFRQQWIPSRTGLLTGSSVSPPTFSPRSPLQQLLDPRVHLSSNIFYSPLQQVDDSLCQVNIRNFWSEELPLPINVDGVKALKQLPPATLEKLGHEVSIAPSQHKIKSVIYQPFSLLEYSSLQCAHPR